MANDSSRGPATNTVQYSTVQYSICINTKYIVCTILWYILCTMLTTPTLATFSRHPSAR